MTAASSHPSRSIRSTFRLDRAAPAGAVAFCAVTIVLWAVVALLAVAPAQAQTVTIEKISGKESFDAGATTRTVGTLTSIGSTAHFRIRARGSDAPFQQFTGDRGEYAGITIGVEFDYQGRDRAYWQNSNYTKSPGNKVSRFEVVLARTWEASGSVAGNRIWDVAEPDMGNEDLHLTGPVIVRLYDPPGGRAYSLGSDREICLVINQSDGTAGTPCSSSQRRGVPRDRLTASFDGLPASHDGQTTFSFRIQFSEDIDATVDGMRDHALNVSGGTVTGAARVNKRDDLWSFTITPSGDAKVEITLAGGASCTADGAICTSDGRQLSSGLLTFVSGPLPTLSIGDAVAYEGVDEHMTFMVSMDRAVTERSWVDYATADGTAEAGSDYTAKSGQLYYLGPDDTGNKGNEGEHKNWLIQVPIIDDTVEDDGETFTVTLSAPKGVTIGRGVATGTIRNSEDPVEISIGDAEAAEGGDGWIRFRLSLNHVAKDVTVDYATADGTATAGVDYTATSGSVVIRKGSINTEIAVPVLNDAVEDDGETFTLTLSNVSGAEIADGEAVGTIRDGEGEPVSTVSTGPLWSADMSVTDFGNGSIGGWGADKFSNIGGTGDLEATRLWYHTGERKLRLAFTTATPDTTGLSLYMGDVAVAMPDGAGDSSFTWADIDVAWTDGETVPVRIAGGSPVVVPSANTAPTGLPTIAGTAQVGETLTASVDEIEDEDGLDDATFTYQWVSNDGTSDSDIEDATDSTYELVAADAGKTIKVRVTFTDDGGTEETLVSEATDAVNTAPTGLPAISGPAQVGETLTASADEIEDADGLEHATFTHQWLSNDGTSDTDIEGATDSTYTLAAADAGRTIKVQVTFTDDGGTEESLVSGATDPVADPPSGLSVADAEATEEEDAALDFVVTLDPSATTAVTVDYATADGTATAGADYTATSGTLTFQPSETSKTVSVPITDDAVDDGGETLTLTLSSASGADLGDAEATGTIRNTEPESSGLSVADAEATEEEDAALDFVVTLDPAATATVTVDYATADGTATAGSDYTATSGALTFQPGDTEKTVLVPITDDAVDDGGETLTLTLSSASGADLDDAEATGTIQNTETPLTASFEDVPSEHDGSTVFTFRLRFSEDPAVSYTVLRDRAFSVSGGTVKKARRVDGRNDLREIHVQPKTTGEIRIDLPATTDCDAVDAICTGDGRPLSHSLSETIAGPVGISVADARVEEDDGAVLSFAVTLSRAASGALTVDYATSDGSAQAGVDYTAASGTLTFQAGESSRTIDVSVLDDSHDDDGETLTLTLSNPSSGRLTNGEATGTIENRDPLPRALLARFGRTAAVHVVEHVEERMEAPREPGFRGRFAGQELRRGMERDFALSFLSQLGGAAGLNGPGVGPSGAMAGSPAGGVAALGTPGLAGAAPMAARGLMGAGAGPMGSAADPMGAEVGLHGRPLGGGLLSMGLGGDLLTGSDFALNRETQSGILSFWSRGARSYFSGRDGALSLGGDVRTTMFGADYAKGPLVAGLSLSHSRGLGEYLGTSGGQVASAVTGLYPWLGYQATDRVTVWGVAGYGAGGMLLTPDGAPALESGLSMAMAAAGTRGELVAGGASGFELAFKADALWVGTSIDGVDGPAGRLKATAAAVTRFRTGLEGSQDYSFAGRLSLRPSVEVGLRHDGGDAETGAGMDVGGGLVVSDASTGLSVDVRVRMLVVHQAEGFRERGMALSLSYNPTPSTPLGFTARVAPSWGGVRRRVAPRRCGDARRWRAWRTAASRRATASMARSATGCRWGAASSGHRGSASGPPSTGGTTGWATASARSAARVRSSSLASTRSAGRAPCRAARITARSRGPRCGGRGDSNARMRRAAGEPADVGGDEPALGTLPNRRMTG